MRKEKKGKEIRVPIAKVFPKKAQEIPRPRSIPINKRLKRKVGV